MPRVDVQELIPNLFERQEMQSAEGRIAYFSEQFGIVHPSDMSPEAAEYHKFIEEKLVENFVKMSPDVIADPEQFQVINCLDENALKVADSFAPEIRDALRNPDNHLAGGLFFISRGGIMEPYVASRIFNKKMVGAMHTGCGVLKLTVGTNQGDIQVMRHRAMNEMFEQINTQAAIIREVWRADQEKLEPEEEAAIDAFNGPLVKAVAISEGGTASHFIRTKRAAMNLHSLYSKSDLKYRREQWVSEWTGKDEVSVSAEEITLGGIAKKVNGHNGGEYESE
jgi:hypothetical protein